MAVRTLPRPLHLALRALNTDIQRNLLGPSTRSNPSSAVRANLSGDSGADTEQRHAGCRQEADASTSARNPYLTPESLTSSSVPRRPLLLTSLATVILDEVHAVFPTNADLPDHRRRPAGRAQRRVPENPAVGNDRARSRGCGLRGRFQNDRGERRPPLRARPISIIFPTSARNTGFGSPFRRRRRREDRSIWEPIAKELRRIISGTGPLSFL